MINLKQIIDWLKKQYFGYLFNLKNISITSIIFGLGSVFILIYIDKCSHLEKTLLLIVLLLITFFLSTTLSMYKDIKVWSVNIASIVKKEDGKNYYLFIENNGVYNINNKVTVIIQDKDNQEIIVGSGIIDYLQSNNLHRVDLEISSGFINRLEDLKDSLLIKPYICM